MNTIKDFLQEKIGELYIVDSILEDYQRSENRRRMREKVLTNLGKAVTTYDIKQYIYGLNTLYVRKLNSSDLEYVLSALSGRFLEGNFTKEQRKNGLYSVRYMYVKEDLTIGSLSPIFMKNKRRYQ